MRYKNWKMRQICNVLVINPFFLDIMTLLVPKTTDFDALDKFFIFTMEIHVSIFVVAFSPIYVLIKKKKPLVFYYCHAFEDCLDILMNSNRKIES